VTTLVLANFPIAFLIFAAIVGIPLWLTFKRPDRAPGYARGRAPQTAPVLAATDGLSTVRQHAAARTTVPGRRHAAPARPVRSHATQPKRGRIPA
jgi:hypothetical protein